MLKIWVRPAMIVTPLALGACFPEVHSLQWVIRWALIFMLFLAFLGVRLGELKPRSSHWCILAANLAMGVTPYVLLNSLGAEYHQMAQVAFFVGITPTAVAAPVIVSFLNGRVGYVVTGFIITNFFVACSLVFLIPWVSGHYTVGLMLDVLKNLAIIIGVPMTLATVVLKIHPAAVKWPQRFSNLSLAIWGFNLFILSGVARQHFIDHPEEPAPLVLGIAGISLLLCAINFALGRFIAPQGFKLECGQLLGQKNTTLTIYMALNFVDPLVAMGPTFYILWHNTWNAYQMFVSERKKARKVEPVRVELPAKKQASVHPQPSAPTTLSDVA